jgi:hypothetical protein
MTKDSQIEESIKKIVAVEGRLGAYLNTMVDDLGIDNKGQYLRDLFGKFEEEVIKELTTLLNTEIEKNREHIKLCAKEQSCSMCKEFIGKKQDLDKKETE